MLKKITAGASVALVSVSLVSCAEGPAYEPDATQPLMQQFDEGAPALSSLEGYGLGTASLEDVIETVCYPEAYGYESASDFLKEEFDELSKREIENTILIANANLCPLSGDVDQDDVPFETDTSLALKEQFTEAGLPIIVQVANEDEIYLERMVNYVCYEHNDYEEAYEDINEEFEGALNDREIDTLIRIAYANGCPLKER